jgi:trigger factor
MDYKSNKIDEANISITSTIKKSEIDKNLDKLAKMAAKTMDIQGFRKGKVPISIVKKTYGKKLQDDANNDCIRELYDTAIKGENINKDKLTSEPTIPKFVPLDNGDIDIQLDIHLKPTIDLGDYKQYIPELKPIKVAKKQIDERLDNLANSKAQIVDIKTKRAVQNSDFVLIDFEGFKDGIAFDGGKADNYSLEIGSGSFVPGFEEQVIGMTLEEKKDIEVVFPAKYQAKELAGAKVVFKIKLLKIQEKKKQKIDDEFAKQFMTGDKDASLAKLTDDIKQQLINEKKNNYFMDEIKPKFMENLVTNYSFAVPSNIVDQEVNQLINKKLGAMSEEEISKLQKDEKFVEKLREEFKEEATNSVAVTFLISDIANKENIVVTDEQVNQTIYYEAMMSGQDGKELIKQYDKKGYMPAVKISMIEQQLFVKLFDEKLNGDKSDGEI